MTDANILLERGRSQEEEYFLRRERERLAALHAVETEAHVRRQLAGALGTHDAGLIGMLRDLGLTRETVPLVHVVPLVEMAWRGGTVTARESACVLELAASRGVQPGSRLHEALVGWLATRPGDDVFARATTAIASLVARMPPAEADESRRRLLAECQAVARASDGLLGVRTVTAEEQALLRSLEDRLDVARARTHAAA